MLNVSIGQKKPHNETNGYKIKFILEGLNDSLLYVANYYADKTYMFDSIRVSKKEPYTYILQGDTAIPRGVYVLAGQNKNKYLDFIVDSSVFFTAHVKNINPEKPDFINNITYTNSPENKQANDFFKKASYFQYQIFVTNKELKEAEGAKKVDNKLVKKKKESIKLLNDSLSDFMNQFVKEHGKENLFGKIQLFAQDVEVPEPPKDNRGNLLDSNFEYYYFINHYWDNCDFNDMAMSYTPVFQPRLEMYYNKVIPPVADSLIKYTDILLQKMLDANNLDMFKYSVWYVANKYERSQYIGHDAVFVHVVLNYYAKGLCPWTEEAVLEKMINHAEQLDNVLLGKKAPELWMFDTNDNFVCNYSFNKDYTIMWFWDTDCGHCKTATPKLIEFYNEYKDSLNFEIYAICMGSDVGKWKKAIVEKNLPWVNVGGNKANIDFRKVYGISTTPYIFVLDKNKRIICKKISVDDLKDFIINHRAGKRIQ